jgi:hypothetical protein
VPQQRAVQPRPQRQRKPGRVGKPQPPAPPAQPVKHLAELGATREPVAAKPGGARAANFSRTVAGPAIARLLRPEVLRKQFILTEILRPPVALRDDDR